MVTCSGSVLFSPSSMSGIFLSFGTLMSLNRSNWPCCLLWHEWLPGLTGLSDKNPWASSFGDLAFSHIERCLGAYLADCSCSWTPPEYWDADIALEMSEHPNFGLMVAERISLVGGFAVAGAGVHLPASELAFDGSVWGTAEEYVDARLERCRAFFCQFLVSCRLLNELNFGGAIVALQAYWPCHLGIDNLNVSRTVGRLLDKDCLVKPLPLVDGDLVALVQYMIRTGGRETVRVTKVKGHAEDTDVQHGQVRLEDQVESATLKLILLLTWVVVISLRYSLMPDVGCSRLVVIGTLSFLICIDL